MKCRLLNLLSALSLVLCVAVGAVWVRRYDEVPPRVSYFQKSRIVPMTAVRLGGVPCWVLAVVTAVPPCAWAGAWSIRRTKRWFHGAVSDHRTFRGLCPACGYDLRATPDQCPECGGAAAARQPIAGRW